jgi:hypothetical protein
MLSRGGSLTQYLVKPDGDETWSVEDWSRAMTLEARWSALGVSEDERRRYIPCAVLVAKFPGLVFPDSVTKRLAEFAVEN